MVLAPMAPWACFAIALRPGSYGFAVLSLVQLDSSKRLSCSNPFFACQLRQFGYRSTFTSRFDETVPWFVGQSSQASAICSYAPGLSAKVNVPDRVLTDNPSHKWVLISDFSLRYTVLGSTILLPDLAFVTHFLPGDFSPRIRLVHFPGFSILSWRARPKNC